MVEKSKLHSAIRAGDLDGLGRVYSIAGELMMSPGEQTVAVQDGCDTHITGSWRSLFAKKIFSGTSGPPNGRLYTTSQRLVLIRDVDVWQEVKPLLTPLGLPAAAETEARLKQVKARGGRQYCEISTTELTLDRTRVKHSMLILYLTGPGGQRFRVIVHTAEHRPDFYTQIESRFKHGVETAT